MDPVTEDLPSQLDAADVLAVVDEVITKVPAESVNLEDVLDKVKSATLKLGIVEEVESAVVTVENVLDKIKEAEVAHLPVNCGFMEPLRMFLQSVRQFLSKPKGPLTSV
jgi:hypothetical protein